MIEIAFRELFDYQYPNEQFYELYVSKNGLGEVLYVGISSQNIWNRWFGLNGHLSAGPRFMIGVSPVGQKIVDHLPDSWSWKIQLWSLEDCCKFCVDELNPQSSYTIKLLEPIMIQKLSPILNSTYNLHPG